RYLLSSSWSRINSSALWRGPAPGAMFNDIGSEVVLLVPPTWLYAVAVDRATRPPAWMNLRSIAETHIEICRIMPPPASSLKCFLCTSKAAIRAILGWPRDREEPDDAAARPVPMARAPLCGVEGHPGDLAALDAARRQGAAGVVAVAEPLLARDPACHHARSH